MNHIANKVDIWDLDLNLPRISNLISDNETASRCILKQILSKYVNIKPADILITNNDRGKPILEHTQYTPYKNIFFNLSKSKNRLLIAVSNNPYVGIDIEHMDPSIDFINIAKEFFSFEEYSLIMNAPIHNSIDLFYDIWTAKEAYVKALGVGLYYPLTNFTISLKSSNPIIIDNTIILESWGLRFLPTTSGFKAAVVIQAPHPQLRFLEL